MNRTNKLGYLAPIYLTFSIIIVGLNGCNKHNPKEPDIIVKEVSDDGKVVFKNKRTNEILPFERCTKNQDNKKVPLCPSAMKGAVVMNKEIQKFLFLTVKLPANSVQCCVEFDDVKFCWPPEPGPKCSYGKLE